MAADSSDRPGPPGSVVIEHLKVGAYELALGDPVGAAIAPLREEQQRPPELTHALEAPDEHQPAPLRNEAQGVLSEASRITSKAEHAVSLFTKIAQGRLDPETVSDEVDEIVGLLGRLDREGRWRDVLQLARSLATLLALLKRWLDLVRSLRAALRAAEQLADEGGQAWALHELGTLHLVAERLPDADSSLSRACKLRDELGERRGLAVTERNLRVLCHTLRARLHKAEPETTSGPSRPDRVVMLALAIVPLIVGGAAGAMIRGSGGGGKQGSPAITQTAASAVVQIAADPTAPRIGDPVSFHITGNGVPASARYAWSFGDHHHAGSANPVHVYREAGLYTIGLTVRATGGELIAHASGTLHLRGRANGHGTNGTSTRTQTTPAPATSTLIVTKTGDGEGTVKSREEGIDCGESCAHRYSTGERITLIAEAAPGSEFVGWSDPCSDSEICEFALSANTTVIATFDQAPTSPTKEERERERERVSSEGKSSPTPKAPSPTRGALSGSEGPSSRVGSSEGASEATG